MTGHIDVKLVGWPKAGDVLRMSKALGTHERQMSATCARGYDAIAEFRDMLSVLGSLADCETITLMAYDGEDPVGYLQLSSGAILGKGSGLTVRDHGWYVLPEYRPRAGKALALSAAKIIKDLRAQAVQSFVLAENSEARARLERNGWRPVAIVYEREVDYE